MLFSDFVLSVLMAGCAASILLPTTSASDAFLRSGIDDVISFIVVWSGLEHFGIFNLSKVWTRDPDQPE